MIREIFQLQNPWRWQNEFPFNLHRREILPLLIHNMQNPRRLLGLIGSRQVGKSSLIYLLIRHLLQNGVPRHNIYYFNLDDLKLHDLFENLPDFISFIDAKNNNSKKFIFIDEVQRLASPGLFLKSLYDLGLNIKIIYSGSSQLEIGAKLKEHLVGRTRQFEIQRLSLKEYLSFTSPSLPKEALEEILIYGAYPGVVLEQGSTEKKLAIKDIYQTYVEKDLTDYLRIKNITGFNTLLGLLSNQTSSLLNIDSLATAARLPRKKVIEYIELLESTFIIRRIYPFHRNYKKEITRTPKIFFLDLGLRNFAINNFSPLLHRTDQGELFENFVFTELLHKDYLGLYKINFWRTSNQTEIDFIVTTENGTVAIEVKWNRQAPPKSFRTIQQYYPEIETHLITRDDFINKNGFDFLEQRSDNSST